MRMKHFESLQNLREYHTQRYTEIVSSLNSSTARIRFSLSLIGNPQRSALPPGGRVPNPRNNLKRGISCPTDQSTHGKHRTVNGMAHETVFDSIQDWLLHNNYHSSADLQSLSDGHSLTFTKQQDTESMGKMWRRVSAREEYGRFGTRTNLKTPLERIGYLFAKGCI
jgi:hypothetical protein